MARRASARNDSARPRCSSRTTGRIVGSPAVSKIRRPHGSASPSQEHLAPVHRAVSFLAVAANFNVGHVANPEVSGATLARWKRASQLESNSYDSVQHHSDIRSYSSSSWILRLRQRTWYGLKFLPSPWTWRPIVPRGVRASRKSAQGTSLIHVLIESPRHSTRYLFH